MANDPVLITGCSTGIGRATAERLARSGMSVYATARKLDSIADLQQAGCKTLALDVTDEESMKAAVSLTTRSPSFQPRTFLPTWQMVPQNSCPSTTG